MSAPSPPPRGASTPALAVRVFAAFLVARAVFGAAYLAAAVGKMPILWYYPLDHAWEMARAPHGPAMGWFGLTAVALMAAAAAGGLAFLAAARGRLARALSRASIVLAIAHAGGLVLLLDFAYFGWTLTHQTPAPWPERACPP